VAGGEVARQARRSLLVTLYPREHPRTAARLLPAGLLFHVTAVAVDSSRVRSAEAYRRRRHPDLVPAPDPAARLAERTAWARLHLQRAEYFTAHGLWDLAADEAARVVAWLPDLAVGWYNLGFVRMMAGDAAAAVSALERALAEDAAVSGARTALARLALARGDGARARELLTEELSLLPGDAQARTLMDHLERAP
jgi:tetratricopeptide (TPR) repeat protein